MGCCLLRQDLRCNRSGNYRVEQNLRAKERNQVFVEAFGTKTRSQTAFSICSGGVSANVRTSGSLALTRQDRLAISRIRRCLHWLTLQWWVRRAHAQTRISVMILQSAAIKSISLLLVLGLVRPVEAIETIVIKSCYDGDTCTAISGERIRLACIDTPELEGNNAKPAPAIAAKYHLSGLLINQRVSIRRITTDRYGRTVGELFVDGMNVQQAMVASGHAKIFWKYASQCPWTQ